MISCENNESKFNISQVFRYNEHSNISSLDPAFAKDQRNIWAVHQLYNGLVQLDDSLRVIPSIAKSWQISEDGKVYTFTLRDDVYFHEHSLFENDVTRLVTATDFEYSFQRLLDKNIVSRPNIILMHGDKDDVVPVTSLLEAREFFNNKNYKIETKILKNCEHRIPTEGSSLGLEFLKKNLY